MHGVVDAQPVSRHGHVVAVHLQQSFGSRVNSRRAVYRRDEDIPEVSRQAAEGGL